MLYRDPGLAEREAIYRQVTSTAGVGAFTWDLTEQRCLWCSEQLGAIYEGTVEDYLREMGTDSQLVDRIHPDDVEHYVTVIQDVTRSLGSYRISYRCRTKSNRYIHVVEAAEASIDPATGHLLMVGCVIDETPHKEIERVLRETNETLEHKVVERTAALKAALARAEEAESRFLAAAQALQEGLAIFDAQDRLTFFNDRHVALLPEHARPALQIGRTFREMVKEVEAKGPVYHQDMGSDFVARRLAMHDGASGEVLVRYPDDHWVLIKEGRMADGGRVILTTDVTEDQRREQRLRLLAMAVEQAGDSVEICDQNYRLIYVNPAFTRLTGWTSDEAIGRTPASLLRSDVHDSAFYEDIEQTVESGRTWTGRIVSLHREGRLIHQEATISPLFDDSGRLTHSLAIKRDVTREVETRAALAESQARLAAFMQNAPVGMYVKSLDGRYLMANPEMERVFGLPVADVLGKTAAEVFGEHEAEFIGRFDQEVIQSGETSAKEEFLPDVTDYAWSLVLRFPIKDSTGCTVEIAGFDVDITAQKMAQERMAASEAFFRSIVEDQSEYIIRLDPKLIITFVNAAFARKRGEEREAIVGRRMLDLIAPEDHEAYQARLKGLTVDLPTVSTEVVLTKADGTVAYEQWTDRAIYDASSNLVGFQSVGRDVTAERRAEAELRRSERGFRELVEAHPMPLAVMSLDSGQPLFASASFQRALGIALSDMRTGDIGRFYDDPGERARIYARLRLEGAIEAIEVTLRRSDGSTFPALMRCRVTTLGGREVVLSSFVDLTDQKRLEEEMERQREALYQSEKLTAMGSLLAGVAHELNNPLSVVIGQAEMLMEEASDGSIRRRAERIHRNADRCARIVRTFLAIARQKSRDRKLVAVDGLIDGAVGLAAYGFKADGVEVIQQVASDLPPVLVDEDQLHQVLTNILVNAQQALRDQEGPRRLTIAAQPDGASVVIRIEDNGPGVPEAHRSRIFEPFFTTKPIGVGTGLGLALCHAIITSHGGSITVENVPAGGARFVIRLPAGTVAALDVQPEAGDALEAPSAVVLIVDDEPEIVELLSEALGMDGHRVLVAPNGREALEILRRQRVDLVLTDLRLPEVDGQRLQSLAAELPDPPPFLFMTGDTLSSGHKPGGLPSPLIEKPLRPADVRSAVARELALTGAS